MARDKLQFKFKVMDLLEMFVVRRGACPPLMQAAPVMVDLIGDKHMETEIRAKLCILLSTKVSKSQHVATQDLQRVSHQPFPILEPNSPSLSNCSMVQPCVCVF